MEVNADASTVANYWSVNSGPRTKTKTLLIKVLAVLVKKLGLRNFGLLCLSFCIFYSLDHHSY